MAVGNEVAVIVATRRGRNNIVHTRGIDVKHVLQTSQDVANHLEKFQEDASGRLQGPSSYGQVQLDGTSFTAVYRIINQAVVMVLAQNAGNVFNSVNSLSTISRILLHESKGGDSSLEKMGPKKLSQIYLAIDAIISKGYTELGPAYQDALGLIEGFHRSKSSKSPKDALTPSLSAPPAPLTNKRKLSQQAAMLSKFSFQAPQEVLDLPAPPSATHTTPLSSDPLAMFQMDGMSMAGPGASMSGAPVDPNDPFSASQAFSTTANDPFGQDDPFGSGMPTASKSVDPFSLDALAAGPTDPLAGFETPAAAPPIDGFEASPWGGSRRVSAADGLAAATAMRRTSTQGQGMMLPTGPTPSAPLLLKEVWQGEVAGSQLVRAGVSGHVQWASDDSRSLSPSIAFSLLVSAFPDSSLKKALTCARLHRTAATTGPAPRTFIAQSAASAPATTPLLQYQLPATFCKPPLTVQAGFTCTETTNGCALLIGLQFALNPNLGLPIQGIVVDMVVPEEMAAPLRVDPKAQWSPSQRAARWTLANVLPGATGTVNGFFLAKLMGPVAAFRALKDVRITAKLMGTLGQCLSGTALKQGSLSGSLHDTLDACTWEAHIHTTLDVPDSPYLT